MVVNTAHAPRAAGSATIRSDVAPGRRRLAGDGYRKDLIVACTDWPPQEISMTDIDRREARALGEQP